MRACFEPHCMRERITFHHTDIGHHAKSCIALCGSMAQDMKPWVASVFVVAASMQTAVVSRAGDWRAVGGCEFGRLGVLPMCLGSGVGARAPGRSPNKSRTPWHGSGTPGVHNASAWALATPPPLVGAAVRSVRMGCAQGHRRTWAFLPIVG